MKLVEMETIVLSKVENRAWGVMAQILEGLERSATNPEISELASIAGNALAELVMYLNEDEEDEE